ncbi:MAG TPA: shikimate dehydrogenase [Marmoricola sp.]|nr:shikimate dehydrogenase [Marmoricola sp.]
MSGVRRSTLTGLVGQGIGPSLTPELHEREAERQGLRYVYKTVDLVDDDVDPDRLGQLVRSAVRLGFDGLNVTHPVKQMTVPLVDRVSAEVAAVGALNTVVVTDGATVGHNTDLTAFERSFTDGLPGVSLADVVLLGAGGAGTAVAHALVRLGVQRLRVVDPDRDRGAALVESVQRLGSNANVEVLDRSGLEAAMRDAAGLVNATPVGMAHHPGIPLPEEQLRPTTWVADIVYRPLRTRLLRAAEALGCQTLSGAGMAVHQAADAFELITGRAADRSAMFHDFDLLVAAEADGEPMAREPSGERKQ